MSNHIIQLIKRMQDGLRSVSLEEMQRLSLCGGNSMTTWFTKIRKEKQRKSNALVIYQQGKDTHYTF